MSVARQKSPYRLTPFYLMFALVIAALCSGQAQSLPSDSVVTDPQTGLAIDGFDPVAYFTGAGPTVGRAAFEYRLAGVTWRFRSEGNRDAFADHPEVYAPQFGGYDPVAIARGISVAGHPLTWLVAGERLYLFYDAKARADFIVAPQRAIEAAQRRWPEVRRTLP
jgi:YHS domain-containing protein